MRTVSNHGKEIVSSKEQLKKELDTTTRECNRLKAKLALAVSALEWIDTKCSLASDPVAWPHAHKSLKQISEIKS